MEITDQPGDHPFVMMETLVTSFGWNRLAKGAVEVFHMFRNPALQASAAVISHYVGRFMGQG
jgi:hypothetical protein